MSADPGSADGMGAGAASRAGWPRTSPPSSPASAIASVEVDAKPGQSPEPVRRRLRDLSDRTYGSQAIRLRERPIPWAYRVFFRQIGLDPDRTRTPVEQLTLDRLHDGGFRSHGLPKDALDIAIVETGVALRAFDAERVEGRLCIRDSAPGESLAGMPGRDGAGNAGRSPTSARRSGCSSARPPRARGSSGRVAGRGRRGPGQGGAADRRRGGFVDGRFDVWRRRDYNFRDACSAETRGVFGARRRGRRARGASAAAHARSPGSRPSWPGSSPRPSVTPRFRTASAPSRPSRGCSISASWRRSATVSPTASPRRGRRWSERKRVEDENRELVERMLAAPQDFKWVRVSREDLGLPGCGHWHSRPRLGPIGMLMGWWRVKVSSGCPLSGRLAAVER